MTADIIKYQDLNDEGKVTSYYRLQTGIEHSPNNTKIVYTKFYSYLDAVTFLRYLNGAPIDCRIEAMLNKYNL